MKSSKEIKDIRKSIRYLKKLPKCNMIGTQGMIQIRCGELGRLCPDCMKKYLDNQHKKEVAKNGLSKNRT